MKHSFLCPHSIGLLLLVVSFALAAQTYKPQPGGKAIKADLVAMIGGLKKIIESETFQEDFKTFLEDQLGQIELNNEQLKDAKQLLGIFKDYSQLDQEALADELKEYSSKMSEVYQQQMEERAAAEQAGEPYYVKDPIPSDSVEKGELMQKQEDLAKQLEEKIPAGALDAALTQVFGDNYLQEYLVLLTNINAVAANAGLEVVEDKLSASEPEDDDEDNDNDED